MKKSKDWEKKVNHILVGLCSSVTELTEKVEALEMYNQITEYRHKEVLNKLENGRKGK
jgi:hypothetical protein